MTRQKIAVSVPADLVAAVKEKVAAGEVGSVSAFVSEALAEKLRGDRLADVLAEMDREHGSPGPEAEAWARRVLGE